MHELMGMVKLFALEFAPSGWLPCDGRKLDVKTYEALFQVLGTTYGGDGKDNFALPDLRSKQPGLSARYCIFADTGGSTEWAAR